MISMHRSSHQPAAANLKRIEVQTWRRLFGSMVQDCREALGRSVEEAARLSGMEASEWLAIEAGHIPADPERLRPMADALEIDFEQMAMTVFLCQGAWAE